MNVPADYEACGECGFDHGYEQTSAARWHAKDTITVANKYVDNESIMATSAVVALDDAQDLFDKGAYPEAAKRALTSLSYSLGILSPVYQRAKANLGL